MRFSRNPKTGILECYTDEGKFVGTMASMGDATSPEEKTATDEEVWRTSEEGHHFKFDDETGEIKAGFGGRLNGEKVGKGGNASELKELQGKRSAHAETSRSSVERMKQLHESKVLHTFDVEGVSEHNMASIESATTKAMEKFPFLKGHLGFDKKCSEDAFAECQWFGDGTIHLNIDDYEDDDLDNRYAESVRTNESPAGTDGSAVVSHEIGHIVDGWLTRNCKIGRNSSASKYIQTATLKALGLTEKDITKELCSYGANDEYEWFAECMAEVLSSKHPRRMAVECMNQVELLLQGGLKE